VIDPEGLCTLIPVVRGHEGQLRDRIRGMPVGPRSPMIRVHGTHYARWAVVTLRDEEERVLDTEPALLLFASEFDGAVDDYVRRLCTKLGRDAHEIWCHCEGYPGADPEQLARFLLEHRLRPGYSVVAYPGVSVDDVRSAFALRERLNDFLVRTATLDSRALHRAWEARFRANPV
jgi:hypothetical protein